MPRHRRWCGIVVLAALGVAAGSGCATVDPLDDTRIEAEVKARLVAEKSANLTRIGVVSSRAIVYLRGTVESDDQKVRAEVLTKEVTGVKRVVNTLEVRSTTR